MFVAQRSPPVIGHLASPSKLYFAVVAVAFPSKVIEFRHKMETFLCLCGSAVTRALLHPESLINGVFTFNFNSFPLRMFGCDKVGEQTNFYHYSKRRCVVTLGPRHISGY